MEMILGFGLVVVGIFFVRALTLGERARVDLQNKLQCVETERHALSNRVAAFEESEAVVQAQYKEQLSQLTFLIQSQQEERRRLEQEKAEAEQKRVTELKLTWSRHESSVEQKMKLLCQKLVVEYVGKEAYPYKGAPDNCVRICGELIVFDCKSPQGEDLSNFPSYIRAQTEAAVKYAKADDVAKDLYFVVPTSAVGCLENVFWNQGAYRVHIITPDALEPILIARQQVEGYELAGKLDPADREKICLTIGRMAHGMKRRIQVDQYFTQEFMTLLLQTEGLPSDIFQEATRIERASKLNPPTAKRAKPIESRDLKETSHHLNQVAKGLAIETPIEVRVVEAVETSEA